MSRLLLYAPERVSRTLNRMASEIVERNRGAEGLVVCGIKKRGALVAAVLASRIGALVETAPPCYALDVSAYRDDRPFADTPEDIPFDATNRDVLLVDDVLYTGRTARAALDALVRYGRPRSIQLAVLVDRGHREYPIQPDYVGRTIPTKYRERVVVDVEAGFAILLEE